jgi:hypothetical protein
MPVYVPAPEGGSQSQRSYFQENFKMELIGANYVVVETRANSVYTLLLGISDNPYFNNRRPMDDDNNRYILSINLERSTDNAEIVSFTFPFTDIESMSEWNLFLLYQAMANAYIPDFSDDAAGFGPSVRLGDDRWRNQLLYIGIGLGLNMGYFIEPGTIMTRQGITIPCLRVGVEYHFLNFLSIEADIPAALLYDGNSWIFEPGLGAVLKGVLKPGNYMMLEPYAGVEFSLPLSERQDPRLAAMAGAQLGMPGGRRGAITVDFSAIYNLMGKMYMSNGEGRDILKFVLLAGYKFGILER